jgi:multidrug efflux pump subunit AcrA (membrane-fusion protein)
MATNEQRRSFLLGITLNELSFIMFFLIMFISATTLQKTNAKLKQKTQHNKQLQAELIKEIKDQNQVFKRLQLLEARLIKAGRFSASPTQQQLDQLFSRMTDESAKGELQQQLDQLQREVQSLQRYKLLDKIITSSGLADSSFHKIEQVLQQEKKISQQLHLLKGRLAYSQKKLKNSGLGYPPCWADPQSGAVEYLYTITLYEQVMLIEAAWPDYRKADLNLIPDAEKLVGQKLDQQQMRKLVKPIFNWSKSHECRHFIRIKDQKETSKQAFKQQMLVIEDYFYKYLVR